jgi:uncharacterized protein YuzB (UPF0349 family)
MHWKDGARSFRHYPLNRSKVNLVSVVDVSEYGLRTSCNDCAGRRVEAVAGRDYVITRANADSLEAQDQGISSIVG